MIIIMRKLALALAFAGLATSGFAQDYEAVPTQKYSVATNSFWSNWFIQAGGQYNVWYSNQEHHWDLTTSPFKSFRSSYGASLALGKWFTPGLGLRTKLSGIWGKRVIGEGESVDNKYWLLNEHVMFNLSNLFCGYNPTRVWNMIVFAGGGIGRSMSTNLYAMDLSAGLQSQWRLSKHVGIYLEAGWNRAEGDLDGWDKTNAQRGWESHDNDLYAELGLNFNLGRATWDKTPDVDAIKALSQSQIDALNAQLNDANAENARLKNLLANKKDEQPKSVKEFVTTPVSVFFNINKTNIASQKDLVNVQALAKYAKENNCKLQVTGYADSATGTPVINQRLSEGRANTVANELVKMGVDRSNITTVGKGGVDELSPVSFNRRATVKVAE